MKKVFKWIGYVFLVIVGLFALLLLIFGFNIDNKDGTYGRWSGLIALVQDHREFGYKKNIKTTNELNGEDGVYIIKNTIFSVNAQNQLQVDSLQNLDSIPVFVANKDKDSFHFKLRKNQRFFSF